MLVLRFVVFASVVTVLAGTHSVAADPPSPAPDPRELEARLAALVSVAPVVLARQERHLDFGEYSMWVGISVLVSANDTTLVCTDAYRTGSCHELRFKAVAADIVLNVRGSVAHSQTTLMDANRNGLVLETVGVTGRVTRVDAATRAETSTDDSSPTRHIPHEILAFRTFEIVRGGHGSLYIRRDRWVSACTDTSGAYACAVPASIAPLANPETRFEEAVSLHDDLLMLGYTEAQEDRRLIGRVILREAATSMAVVATIVIDARRLTPLRNRHPGFAVLDVVTFPIFAPTSDCLTIGDSVPTRRVIVDDLEPESLPPPVLRAAPRRVPASGVDPFEVAMGGAWRIQPEGGLQRARECPL